MSESPWIDRVLPDGTKIAKPRPATAENTREFKGDMREEEPSGSLNELAREIGRVNAENGWDVPRPEDWDDDLRIPTFLALIHSEVSEALEGFREGDRVNVTEELADVLIRTLDLAAGLGIDIDAAVEAKIEVNRKRSHKHGGKRI